MPMTRAYKDIVLRLVENERGNVQDNLHRYKTAKRAGNEMHGDTVIDEAIARHEECLAMLKAVKQEIEKD